MGQTNYSGPVASDGGFKFSETLLTSELPAASAANLGQVYLITDNGAGNNETAMVISNGTAWTLTTGAALS